MKNSVKYLLFVKQNSDNCLYFSFREELNNFSNIHYMKYTHLFWVRRAKKNHGTYLLHKSGGLVRSLEKQTLILIKHIGKKINLLNEVCAVLLPSVKCGIFCFFDAAEIFPVFTPRECRLLHVQTVLFL